MALDQVHEQNNEFIKGVGGASHLVNRSDESVLIRWELCGSELAKMISDFEELSKKGGGSSTIKNTRKTMNLLDQGSPKIIIKL